MHALPFEHEARIYLSCPMSNEKKATKNISKLIKELDALGYSNIFNPTSIDYNDDRFVDKPAQGFRQQLTELMLSDVVLFMEGWETARGCITELLTATLTGVTLYQIRLNSQGLIEFTHLPVNRDNVSSVVADLLVKQQLKH